MCGWFLSDLDLVFRILADCNDSTLQLVSDCLGLSKESGVKVTDRGLGTAGYGVDYLVERGDYIQEARCSNDEARSQSPFGGSL